MRGPPGYGSSRTTLRPRLAASVRRRSRPGERAGRAVEQRHGRIGRPGRAGLVDGHVEDGHEVAAGRREQRDDVPPAPLVQRVRRAAVVPEQAAVPLSDFGGCQGQDAAVRAEQQVDAILDDQALVRVRGAGDRAAVVVDLEGDGPARWPGRRRGRSAR